MDDFWLEKIGNLLFPTKKVSCLSKALFILLWGAAKHGRAELIAYSESPMYVL